VDWGYGPSSALPDYVPGRTDVACGAEDIVAWARSIKNLCEPWPRQKCCVSIYGLP